MYLVTYHLCLPGSFSINSINKPTAWQQNKEQQWSTAYQDFVIVLPGVVDNLPQYFKDFCFGEERTESNSQVTINHPPVEHLSIEIKDTYLK